MPGDNKEEELLILSEDNDTSNDFSLDEDIVKENNTSNPDDSIITFDSDTKEEPVLDLEEDTSKSNDLNFDLSDASPEEITTEVAEDNKDNDTFSLEGSDSIVEKKSQQEVGTMEDILSETIKKFEKREGLISEDINNRENTVKSLKEEIKDLEEKVSFQNKQIDDLNKEKESIVKNRESLEKMKNNGDKSTSSKKTTK